MKKTAKTLLGVLSISALIGTGYAMWHISGGFVGTESELTPGIETEVDKNFGYIEVTPLDGDDSINFDGIADEDLTVKYSVKALANEGSSRDPYDLTNYEGVAEEYIPNLKITTIAKDDSGELSADDEFFNYVKLPEVQVVDYKTWLDSTCKDNGYAVTLAFNWSDELGNQNPELAWKGLTVEEQETNYNALIKALEGVKFTFKFEVGNKVDLPTVDETGEITLPTVEGSTLTIEGMKEGVVTAGEHLVTLNIEDENKVLKDSKVTITKTTIEGTETTEDLTLNESFGRATFKTYNAKYNFETGCKYSFAYELENEVIYTTVTEGEHDNVTLSYTVDDKAYTTGEELEVGKTVKVTAVANEGYTLDKVCFNGEALSLTNGTYDFVTTLDKNEVTAYATKNVEVTISLNQESATLEVGDTLELTATVEGLDTYDLVWNSENTEVATVENGKVTALKAGTTTISVYPNGYEDKVASCLVTVNEVEKVYTIAEAISLEDGTENVLVKGKVMSVAYDGFIIADETAYIYVRTYDNIPVVDSNVSITGTKTTYTKSGAIQIENPSINVLEDEVINVKEFDSKEITEEYLSAENSVLMKSLDYVFANDAICVSTGNYINLKINDSYEEKMISIKTTDELGGNFVVGGHYNIKGYVVGLSGSKYLNVYAEFIEKVEIKPESILINNGEELSIFIDDKVKINYSVLPTGSSQEVTYELVEGESTVASIDSNGIITGLSVGDISIKITSTVNLEVNGILTVHVKAKDETPTQTKVFEYVAKKKMDAFGSGSNYGSAPASEEKINGELGLLETSISYNAANSKAIYISSDSTTNPGLKLGSGSSVGAISFNISSDITVSKVGVEVTGWNKKELGVIAYRGNEIVGEYVNFEKNTALNEYVEFDLSSQSGETITISNSSADQAYIITSIIIYA